MYMFKLVWYSSASEFGRVCIKETSSYARIKSFAGSSLPAEQRHYQRTNGPTDGRTHPLTESWLTTKKAMFAHRIGSLVGVEVVLVIKAI